MLRKKKGKLTIDELLRILKQPPLARNTDPDTSHGAKTVFITEDKIEVLFRYRDALNGKFGPEFQIGMTDYDLIRNTGRQQNSFGKRRGEWFKWGMIEKVTGWDEAKGKEVVLKRPAPSTSPCIVWRITELGLEACKLLEE